MGTRVGLRLMNDILDQRRQLRFAGDLSEDRQEEIRRKVADSVIASAEYDNLFRPVFPVLDAWRDANPRARYPRWYRDLEVFTHSNPHRAYLCIALFVQQADGITATAALIRAAAAAVKMAACNHPRGRWSGSVHTVAGEYDDDQIFICPDCGYKGS